MNYRHHNFLVLMVAKIHDVRSFLALVVVAVVVQVHYVDSFVAAVAMAHYVDNFLGFVVAAHYYYFHNVAYFYEAAQQVVVGFDYYSAAIDCRSFSALCSNVLVFLHYYYLKVVVGLKSYCFVQNHTT
jgi:hypothetical protein